MENATLNIKSAELAEILQRVSDYEALSPAKQKKYYDDKSTQQNGEFLIGTFILDLLRCGYRADAALDLTYATLGKLPIALGRSLREDTAAGKDLKTAAEAVAKSLAAYLFALGMNEEGAALKVAQKGTAFVAPGPGEGPLWGPYFRITTGKDREKDFLLPAMEGGSGVFRDGNSLVLLAVGPSVRAYRSAFGVDLREYGLCDMVLEANV